MNIKIHKNRIWLVIAFVYLWMQQVLLHYTSGAIESVIRYSDEVLLCVIIILMGFAAIRGRVRLLKIELWMLGFFAVFAFMGLLSAVIYQYQGLWLSLSDMLVCSRFIIIYFGVRILITEKIQYEELVQELAWVCRLFTVITAVLAIHDIFFAPFFKTFDIRYGLNSLNLFFPHPTYMAIGCATAAVVLMAANAVEGNRRKRAFNMVCIVTLCALMCVTLRSKAMAAAVCIFAFYFLTVKWKLRSRGLLFGGVIAGALTIGWGQLEFYFAGNSADILRARLHVDSVSLASQYFPLGTGFGTFGSNIAAENYSPLYFRLGYHLLAGANVTNPTYLCDAFWPTVIAQTGWIGTIAFIAVLVCFIRIVFRAQEVNRYLYWGMLSIMIYELISSVAEPAFFNPSSAVLFAFLGLMVNMVEREKESRRIMEA